MGPRTGSATTPHGVPHDRGKPDDPATTARGPALPSRIMNRLAALALALLLAGCSTGPIVPVTSAPAASTASATPTGLTPQQQASILASAGIPPEPDPATQAAYVRDLDRIDPDIVHGKAAKAVSRGRDTCHSIKEGGSRAELVDVTRRRFTSPTHPEGRPPAVAERILDVVHAQLCPTY